MSPGHPAVKLGAWVGQVSPPAEGSEGSFHSAWEKDAPSNRGRGFPLGARLGFCDGASYSQSLDALEAEADGVGALCFYLLTYQGFLESGER